MSSLRRTMRVERLESRSLLAAAVGIPDMVMDATAREPQVVASLEIENAPAIRAATVEIDYDESLLQADLGSVRAGSIWAGKGMAVANINDRDGKITAFVFATQDIGLSSGSLLDIDFMFKDEAVGNARANIGLGSLRLNEGEISVSAVPIRGQSAVDGSITRQGFPSASSAAVLRPLPQVTRLPPKVWHLGDTPAEAERPGKARDIPAKLTDAAIEIPGVFATEKANAFAEKENEFFCTPWPSPDISAPLRAAPDPADSKRMTTQPPSGPKAPTEKRDSLPPSAGFSALLGNPLPRNSPAMPPVLAPTTPAAPLAINAQRAAEATDLAVHSPTVLKEIQTFLPAQDDNRGQAAMPLIGLSNGRGGEQSHAVDKDVERPDAA